MARSRCSVWVLQFSRKSKCVGAKVRALTILGCRRAETRCQDSTGSRSHFFISILCEVAMVGLTQGLEMSVNVLKYLKGHLHGTRICLAFSHWVRLPREILCFLKCITNAWTLSRNGLSLLVVERQVVKAVNPDCKATTNHGFGTLVVVGTQIRPSQYQCYEIRWLPGMEY